MPEAPSNPDRLKRQARRFAASLRPHHLAIAAVLTAVGLGVVAARTLALPEPQPVLDGERMTIQVVAPLEPEVAPGTVMEVGDLVEGFEYRRPAPVMSDDAAYAPYEAAFEPRTMRPASRSEDEAGYAPSPPEVPAEDRRDSRADRWFGFDAPERDYRAEREARRARMDARIERERARREVRWYHSDGRPVEGIEQDVPGRWQDEDRDFRRR